MTQRRIGDAVDTFRNTLGSLAAGFGEQLHDGWIHPHSSGGRAGGACLPVDIRPANADLGARKSERGGVAGGPIRGSGSRYAAPAGVATNSVINVLAARGQPKQLSIVTACSRETSLTSP